jgi:hypothetical protein
VKGWAGPAPAAKARTSAHPQGGGPRSVEQGIHHQAGDVVRRVAHPHGFAASSGLPPRGLVFPCFTVGWSGGR